MTAPASAIPAPRPDKAPPRRAWGRLGWIAPRVAAAWLLLDLGLRFVPLTWFPLRDFQIARRWFPLHSPFTPNLRIDSSYFEGDEALEGNLPPTESRTPTRFTTDSLGFRSTPAVHQGASPEVLVFRGFSFTWGAGLSDEEVLPVALARELGVNVYDAARFHEDPELPADVDRLLARLGARPRTAVYVHLEPNGHTLDWNRPKAIDRMGIAMLGESRYTPIKQFADYAQLVVATWFRVSPLNIFCVRLYKSISNDRLLPNVYRRDVAEFRLPDGRPFLARRTDMERVESRVPEDVLRARAEYISWWRDQLAARGIQMTVLLVPEKMSVYGPAMGRPVQANPFLNRLERELLSHGVKVVNGLPLLSREAPAELAAGRLFYFREDHHWNAHGVARLSRAVAEALRSSDPALYRGKSGESEVSE
ncbi:MAG TPA: hypothetical protein VN442_02730 [Bryobacteraceae bacterium]|nr:hypothetical protein [Bryobacteraceae bacterium]